MTLRLLIILIFFNRSQSFMNFIQKSTNLIFSYSNFTNILDIEFISFIRKSWLPINKGKIKTN